MSSLDKLPNSFHAATTNGRLDLSLPRCASCCPTNCPCSTWSGLWMARFVKESVAPYRRGLAGWMPARTGKSSVGVGRKHPVTIVQSIIENAVNEVCMRTTTPNWCAILSDGVDQGKSRDAQCLGTFTPSGPRKSPQQLNLGGEFLAQSRGGDRK